MNDTRVRVIRLVYFKILISYYKRLLNYVFLWYYKICIYRVVSVVIVTNTILPSEQLLAMNTKK